MNVSTVMQKQWFTRRDDEKFASVEDLYTTLADRKARTHQVDTSLSKVEVLPLPNDGIELVDVKSGTHMIPTHWAFNQLCSMVGAHPSFIRELNGDLAAGCINHMIHKRAEEKNKGLGLMVVDPKSGVIDGVTSLMATTSQSYGRIWDAEVVQAALEILHLTGDRFHSPLDWTKQKRALFASDRDMYMFFIDGGSIVEGGGERDQLHRGWILANSEVGAASWKFYTFLFRFCCGNFAIHGLEDVKANTIIHTAGAPMKFVKQALPAIMEYVNASPRPMEQIVKKAKEFALPKVLADHTMFFRVRGFTANEVLYGRMTADKEEGGHDTLWQMLNGFTAYARKFSHRDVRASLETRAGQLLQLVAA